MSDTHIEIIDPKERLSPGLGGTGYVGPKCAALREALASDAAYQAERWPALNRVVWKVLQDSVNWRKRAKTRRLCIDGRTLQCEVIGSVRDWWFVSVDARKAADVLS